MFAFLERSCSNEKTIQLPISACFGDLNGFIFQCARKQSFEREQG